MPTHHITNPLVAGWRRLCSFPLQRQRGRSELAAPSCIGERWGAAPRRFRITPFGVAHTITRAAGLRARDQRR